MPGFSARASSTSRATWLRKLSEPTLVTLTSSVPYWLIDPPITAAPGIFSSGMDSPVTRLSSTLEAPSATSPSTGIDSPGRTRTSSPGRTSSTGTSASRPSRTTRAVAGTSASSLRTAWEARVRTRSET